MKQQILSMTAGDLLAAKVRYISHATGKQRTGKVRDISSRGLSIRNYFGYDETVWFEDVLEVVGPVGK